jgi:hypothetical protein
MARMVDARAEDMFSGIAKSERGISAASTALPSPEFTRMVSPFNDSELDEIQEFALSGLPDDSCAEESTSAKDQELKQVTHQSENSEAGSECVRGKCGLQDYEAGMLFCTTLGALCHYHYGVTFVGFSCVVMGLCAGLMILPGAYLYFVEGCRPEDCDEVPAEKRGYDKDNKESSPAKFWLAMYSLAFVYALWTSGTFRCVMASLALVMILPGTYLFVFGGCRPEDTNDD